MLEEPKERKVDVALALRAFNKVRESGERDGEGFVYGGLRASTDFDGYTVILTDEVTTLRIFFHNKFSLEPTRGKAVERLLSRIKRVANA